MRLKTIFHIPLIGLIILSAIVLFTVILKQQNNQRYDRIQVACAQIMSELTDKRPITNINESLSKLQEEWHQHSIRIDTTLKRIQDDIAKDMYQEINETIELINQVFTNKPDITAIDAIEYQILTSNLIDSVFKLHQKSSFSTRDEISKLSNLLLILTAALPCTLLIILIYVNKWLFPVIENLTTAAHDIAEGNLEKAISVSRDDEIGTLAESMESMRQSLAYNQILIKAKNEEIEAFVYAVSHDLRGPLVNLVGFTNEIQITFEEIKKQETPLNSTQREDLDVSIKYIYDNAHRLEALIDGLLRLSRTGRQDLEPESLQTQEFIRAYVTDFKPQLEAIDGKVEIHDLPPIYIDQAAFERILSNLLTNAIKYRDPNRALHLDITGGSENGYTTLTFSDNGLGFPETSQDKIFQVFQRFHPNVADGEGMGLLIIKRLIERSGGTISIANNNTCGCSIRISLPADPHALNSLPLNT